jgi:hypothetical protein
VPDVHDRDRVLVGAGEELALDALGVEPGHRPRRQPGRADPDDQVAELDRGVEPGHRRTSRVRLHHVAHPLLDREDDRQVLVERGVGGDDQRQRRGGRLGLVAVGHLRDEPLPRLRAPDGDDPQRLGVHRGRPPLHQVHDGAELLVGDRFAGERVRGAGRAEQQVLRGGVQREEVGGGRHGRAFLSADRKRLRLVQP